MNRSRGGTRRGRRRGGRRRVLWRIGDGEGEFADEGRGEGVREAAAEEVNMLETGEGGDGNFCCWVFVESVGQRGEG